MGADLHLRQFGTRLYCRSDHFEKWAEWGRTGETLLEERLIEVTLGENPRLAGAEEAHRQSIIALGAGDTE